MCKVFLVLLKQSQESILRLLRSCRQIDDRKARIQPVLRLSIFGALKEFRSRFLRFFRSILFVFIPVSLFGSSITEYLAPVSLSEKTSGLEGVDCIYVINLDERVSKWEKMNKKLKKLGLKGNRFRAINGWNMASDRIKSLFGHYPVRMTQGAVGCLLSHLSVVQDGLQRGFKRIWVMEDDLIFHEKMDRISDLLKTLSEFDPDWDIFYTDSNSKDNEGRYLKSLDCDFRPDFEHLPKKHYLVRSKINDDILCIKQRFGMYSAIISEKGMRKILDYFNSRFIWAPIDVDIHFIPNLHEYCAIKDLVTFQHRGTIHDTYTKPKTRFAQCIFKIYKFFSKLFCAKKKKNTARDSQQTESHPSPVLPGWCSEEKAILIRDLIRERKFECIVEIGVFAGASLFPMLEAVKQVQAGVVYGIDPWTRENAIQGFDEFDENYSWWGNCNFSSIYDSFCQMIQENGFDDFCKIIRKPASLAVQEFADGSIDFIHFDGNHSEVSSFEDVINFYPKIKDGGYILLNNPMWATKKRALVFLLERADCISDFLPQAPYLLLRKNIQREMDAEKLFNK